MEIGYQDNNAGGKLLLAMNNLRLQGIDVGKYPLPNEAVPYLPKVYAINPTPQEIEHSLDAIYQSITRNPATKFFFLLPGQLSGLRSRIRDKLGKVRNLEFLTFEDVNGDVAKILEARK